MTSRVVTSLRTLGAGRWGVAVAVGVAGLAGFPQGAFAQEELPQVQVEHQYPPKWNHDRVLRAKYASTPEIQVLPAQGNVYVLFGAGGNIAVSVGPQALAVVNTGDAAMADKV